MRIHRLTMLLAALSLAAPLHAAAIIGASLPAADTSPVATKTEMQASISALTDQMNAAMASLSTNINAAQALAAAACQPMAAVPPSETVGGSAGSGSACRLSNAVQPRISRMLGADQPCITNASGICTASWTATTGGTPGVLAFPLLPSTGSTQAPLCYAVTGTITNTSATIKCFTTQSVVVGVLGATVAPLTTAGANVSVQVLVLPPAS